MGNTVSNTALFRPTEPSYGEELENLIFIPELMDMNVATFWDNEDFEMFNKNENMKELKQKKFPALFLYYTKEEKTKHTIIYFHSNSSDLGQMYEELETLHKHLHANILAFEYVGFGLCYLEGAANQFNINRRAMASYNFLRSINIKSKNILLFGRSIGTGAATKLGYNLKLLKHEIGGIILHSPYISIKLLVEDYVAYASYLIENIYDNFKNLKAVSNNDKSDTPLLIIHGNDDEVVPVSHSKYIMKNLQNKYKNASYPNESYHNYYYVIDDLGIPIKTFLDTLSKSKYAECVDINIPKQFFNKSFLSTRSQNAAPNASPRKNEGDVKKLQIEKNIHGQTDPNLSPNSRAHGKNEHKREVSTNTSRKDKKDLHISKEKIKDTEYKVVLNSEGMPNEETIKRVDKKERNSNSERIKQVQKENEKRKYDENKIQVKITEAKNGRAQKMETPSVAISSLYISTKKESDRGSAISVKEGSSKGSVRNISKSSNDEGLKLLTDEHLKKRKEDAGSRHSSKKSNETSDAKRKKLDSTSKNEQDMESRGRRKTSEKSKSESKGKNEKLLKEQVQGDKKRKAELELEGKVKTTNKTNILQGDKRIPSPSSHDEFFNNSATSDSRKETFPLKNENKELSNKKEKIKEKGNLIIETSSLPGKKLEEKEKGKLKERDKERDRNKIRREEKTELDKKAAKVVKEKEREKNKKNELMPTLQKEERRNKKIATDKEIETKQYGVKPEEQTYKLKNIQMDQNGGNETKYPTLNRNNNEYFTNAVNVINKKKNPCDSYNEDEENNGSDKQYSQYDYVAENPNNRETYTEKGYINNNVTVVEEQRVEYIPCEQQESTKCDNNEKYLKNMSSTDNDSINENTYDIKEFSYYVETNIISRDKIKDLMALVMDDFSNENIEKEEKEECNKHDKYDGIETEQVDEKTDEPNAEEQKKKEQKNTKNDESTQNYKREDNAIE